MDVLKPSVVVFLLHDMAKHFNGFKRLHPHAIIAVLSPHTVRFLDANNFINQTGGQDSLLWFLDAMPFAPLLHMPQDATPRYPCRRMWHRAPVLAAQCLDGFVVNSATAPNKDLSELWDELPRLTKAARNDTHITVRHA